MNLRLAYLTLGLLMVTLLCGMDGGCGIGRLTSDYYYYPNWMPDGRIVCVKKRVITYSGSFVFPGKEEEHYYITTMSDEGTQEADIREISRLGQVVASPLGNYIAVTDWKNLRIFTSTGADVKSIDCGEGINSFDWSPDETRIAYSGDESKDLFVLRVSDEVKTKIASSAEGVAWRVGEVVIYGNLYCVNADGSQNSYLAAGRYPQKISTLEVIYQGADFGVYKMSLYDRTSINKLFSDFSRASLKLSFGGTKIVGGDLDGYGNIKGVWVYTIDGKEKKQLR